MISETDRDNFDICIPINETIRKDDYNAIYLHIHGRGLVSGNKVNYAISLEVLESYVHL